MTVILLTLVLVLAAYFAFRFYLLKKALKETSEQLQVIQKDLKQNQVLHRQYRGVKNDVGVIERSH